MTNIERVILFNQFQILAKLDPNEKGYYERSAKALQSGYSGNYEFLETLSPELSEQECQIVWRTLDMYDAMRTSWVALTDKGNVKEQEIVYRGFDGNNETQYMGYSQFIVEECERFTYMGIKDHNSHMEMIPGYLRMLAAWAQFKESHNMTAEQLRAVLTASHYPG